LRRKTVSRGNIKIPESQVQSSIISFFKKSKIPHNRVNGAQFSIDGKNKRGNPSKRMVRCNSINGKADIEVWMHAENNEGYIIGIPLYIEVKSSHGGRQSDSQKEFQEMLESRGYKYILARSLDDVVSGVRELGAEVSEKLAGYKLYAGRILKWI